MQFLSHRARIARLLATTVFVASAAHIVVPAYAQFMEPKPGSDMVLLPTGVFISPTAIPGSSQQLLIPQVPNWPANLAADEAVRSQLSPDGNTLAIITTGYNDITLTNGAGIKTQFIFVYDVSGANKAAPKLTQVITQNNAFVGLVWSGNTTLYASGDLDDKVYVYTRAGAAPSTPFAASGAVALGHKKGIGIGVGANAGGLAVSADGKTLLVANNYNDSISVIDTASQAVVADYDLRPYNTSGQDGVAGGEFPWGVAMKANGIAFISSVRDREVVAVDVSTPAAPKFVTRIALAGNAYGMTLSADQSMLFVAQENSDQVAVIDTASYAVVHTIDTRAPAGTLAGHDDDRDDGHDGHHDGWDRDRGPHYTGAEPIAVTVSPDGKTLYAVNNGNNSIAVIALAGEDAYTVKGMIPTAYAPKDIAFSADGSQMYIINGLAKTGPNAGYRSQEPSVLPNQYQFALEQASLVTAPVPARHALEELTEQVAKNNLYSVPVPERDIRVMDFLRDKIKHVIYIVRENRTFDQILGDLNNGSNGDPSLTQFGAAVTPNNHALAKNFVTLDNFMDPGDASTDGWSWVMRAGVTTYEELSQQLEYGGRSFAEVCCGANNGVTIDMATTAERDAVTKGNFTKSTAALPGGTSNVMPGRANVGAKDAPFGYQKSYIWEAALNAGRTVRSYGFQMVSNIGAIKDASGNPITDPFGAGVVQVVATNESLEAEGRTDLYYRGQDLNYPDAWRFQEWLREFRQFEANGQLPSLSMIRMGGDHMGSFATEIAGLNTPEKEQAENDYAVGKLVETVAHSQVYAPNTLVIVVEDDSQDGPDHVDSHRAPAYIAGPYVKQGAVVSTHYTLVSALRTMEDILGAEHMNLNTAYARPMSDVFDIRSSGVWTFNAVASTVLQGTGLQVTLNDLGVKYAEGPLVKSTHDVAWWDEATRGFDFSDADRVPHGLFNKVLWEGLMGDKPFPVLHSAYKPAEHVRDDDEDHDGK
jgi:DNA-binding beta-propeller fold protein YncE